MGLYNVMFGEHPAGQALVGFLQTIKEFNVGRYRDAWVEHHGDDLLIRVHTRNGGGNREDYDDGSMTSHPWYVRDEDDDFDSTYADWWFRVDLAAIEPEVAKVLVELAQPPVDVGARWQAAIDAIGNISGEKS